MLLDNANPTPDAELNILLSDLLTGAKSILKENFIGMYLTGSLAVGDFDSESDVDFVIMLHEPTDEPSANITPGKIMAPAPTIA